MHVVPQEEKSMGKMNFEEFKEAIVSDIKKYMPDSYSEAEVIIRNVDKNNGTKLTGLVIQKKNQSTVPTIYLEQSFNAYQSGVELEEILTQISKIREKYEIEEVDPSDITDFEKVKGCIVPRLVNAEMNAEQLQQKPHVLVEDLAVIFAIMLGNSPYDEQMSVQVDNHLADTWGKSTEELYELAVSNLEADNSGRLSTMAEILKRTMPAEEVDFFAADLPMYVITTESGIYGANLLLNKKFMDNVISQLGSDFVILPSSVHECILITGSEQEISFLKQMVSEVNGSEVSPEEVLSNNVYRYSPERGIFAA